MQAHTNCGSVVDFYEVIQWWRLHVPWYMLLNSHSRTQVNLKRKHWGASGAEPPTGRRCRDAFQRQLAPAAAAGPSRGQGGYKVKGAQQGGAQQGASQAPANTRSRPAVKAAGEGPTAGGPGAGAARGRQGRGFKVRLKFYTYSHDGQQLGRPGLHALARSVGSCAS